ncbi:hypothetical protein Q3G72_010984 [Acer saccharum]|nr:hypothetical protein Q3G72_010984 [Acer saccharum]
MVSHRWTLLYFTQKPRKKKIAKEKKPETFHSYKIEESCRDFESDKGFSIICEETLIIKSIDRSYIDDHEARAHSDFHHTSRFGLRRSKTSNIASPNHRSQLSLKFQSTLAVIKQQHANGLIRFLKIQFTSHNI